MSNLSNGLFASGGSKFRRLSLALLVLWSVSGGGISLISKPANAEAVANVPSISINKADKILRGRVPKHSQKPSVNLENSVPARNLKSSVRTKNVAATVVGCASSTSQPVEIITLASSLKCDVDLIYEYVYDNIEYEPLFGSNKGPLGTLLDMRGSDIDQDQLFVALLNVSGITQTSFVYGYITLTGPTLASSPCTATTVASAPGWLGVKNDALAMAQMLANGGIPLGNNVVNGSDGTLECLDVAHVWVQVTISGTNYVFDPSYKQHSISTGISNLGSVLGYTQSQFLADAGGTQDAVSISNINRTNIRADLTSYAKNLVSYIKANNPASRLSDIIGGKTIVPLAGSPLRQTNLPYISTSQPTGFPQNWGATVPNAYRTCLAVTMPGVATKASCATANPSTVVLYSDQMYGRTSTLFSVAFGGYGAYTPELVVLGIGGWFGQAIATGQPWDVYVSVTHPYASTADNQSKDLTIISGGNYLLNNGWGQVGRGMVAKHQQLLAEALAAPGADPNSIYVLGESLAVIGYNWLAERATQQGIGDAIGQSTTQDHHELGIIGQTNIQGSASQGPYVDMPMNALSITQQTCWPSVGCAFPGPTIAPIFSDSGISSSLESAVLQQTQAPTSNMVAASTVQLVDQNASTGAKTFFADGTTLAGQNNYISSIRPSLTPSYSASDLATIDTAITGVSPPTASSTPYGQALVPINGAQSVGLWSGAGYTTIAQTSTSLSIIQKISGSLDGGFSGTSVPTTNLVDNTNITLPVPADAPNVPAAIDTETQENSSFYAEPVDAISGGEVYSNTDLSLGSGQFPYSLPFQRTYQSSQNLVDLGIGNGWSHNYSLTAQANSDPYEGMGASSPVRAADTIAAVYVQQNLLSSLSSSPPSLPEQQSLTLAWIVSHWLTDRLTNNSTLVTHPAYTEEFIALPYNDGATSITYSPPLSTATNLVGYNTGTSAPSTFTYTTKDGENLSFGSSPAGAISSWTYPNGMSLNFTYNGSGQLSTVSNNLGRQLTLSYISNHVSSVSDGTRSVGYSYGSNPSLSGSTLVSASDPLGNITHYSYDTSGGYDTAGHLTQIFYPNAPLTSFVTNFYDRLGRVAKQLNALSEATLFYFAGSRTEIVDPVGDRQVTYQTPSGQITMSAAVLSATYGDVFQSTLQQNGIVNVSTNQYDGLNRLTLATAPEGGKTGYTYSPDFENNIITIVKTAKPGSSLSPLTSALVYDPIWNKPIRITDPRGIISSMSYEISTGNLLTISNDTATLKANSLFTYTGAGLLASSTNPVGVITTYTYDTTGDLIKKIGDAGRLNQTTVLTYDSVGNVTSETDPNGNATLNTYDPDRRLLTSVSPRAPGALTGVTTSLAYDAVGQLLQTSQSSSGTLLRKSSTTYSPTGKVVTSTDWNGNTTTSTYDGVDRLLSVTDPVLRVTSYAYDALSRKISVSNPAFASPLVQMSYTPDGLVATLTNANGYATTFTPDGFDRVSKTTYPNSTFETLTYDADGNVLTRLTRASQTITYTYDTLNRLSTKAAPSEATVTNSYDLAGHLIGASDNSAAVQAATTSGTLSTITATYDALNHLISKIWTPVQAQAPPAASSTTSFAYTYSQSNQRISQTTTDNSWFYYPTTAASVSYSHNNLDQYTAIGSVTPTYNNNGGLTFDGTTTYGYDAENRLISASQGGTTIATYAYDPLGHRKSQTLSGTTTILVNDPENNALVDYAGSGGAAQEWYVFGQTPNSPLNQVNVAAGTRSTLIPDIQGSIVGNLASSTGTLTEGAFQPFGGSATNANATFGYTGSRIAVAGLYDMRARFYSPIIGRFLSPDPIGPSGGINLYVYTGNDPLNYTDPTGYMAEGFGSGFATTTDSTNFSALSNFQNGTTANQTGVVAGALSGFAIDIAEEVGPALALGGVAGGVGELASEAATESSAVEGLQLYRTFGDEARGLGNYYTTVDPSTVANYRVTAGLFPGNSGQFVLEGTLSNTEGVILRQAAPGPGGVGGGLPEVFVPNPTSQITINGVSGVNPPF